MICKIRLGTRYQKRYSFTSYKGVNQIGANLKIFINDQKYFWTKNIKKHDKISLLKKMNNLDSKNSKKSKNLGRRRLKRCKCGISNWRKIENLYRWSKNLWKNIKKHNKTSLLKQIINLDGKNSKKSKNFGRFLRKILGRRDRKKTSLKALASRAKNQKQQIWLNNQWGTLSNFPLIGSENKKHLIWNSWI